ncbi:hypothetical protein [Bifidobacterium vansinderenii]|uniref:Uncharacterized protein n=1 Tax=Bifidobacterium vansinderenii TaxID=1984871 RepID=A0A229W0X2_9BIFI|nr:hypothetical protein [Bifidobacterium vansinderenii]OXN01476.1 hypothetical protein Tam10B_0479 [Bifidobacterium vansinderenii]
MTPLATITDLDGFGISHNDDILAAKLIESVSSAVREAAGCPISRGTWTITIPSEQSRKLDLPCRPVTSVEQVLIDGEETTDWKLLGNALYRETLWGPPGAIPRAVTITLTAGYDPVPPDIVRLVCSMVAAGLSQQENGGPGADRSKAYERIDDYQIGYRQGGSEIIDATELPEATKRSLRQRFGTPGLSIGVFK